VGVALGCAQYLPMRIRFVGQHTLLRPHLLALKACSFDELVRRGNAVDTLGCEEYARVNSFDAYARSGDASARHARDFLSFLRHTLKCTPLFAGDGYTRTEEGGAGGS
jgi:hypothetical protein